MAINRISPKKGKVVDIPTVPTIGTATAAVESATVAFTAATKGGPATTYTAISSPGSFTGTGTSSPVTVSGLTGGSSYTFSIRGDNATGSSEYSSASNSITAIVNPASYFSIQTVTVGSTSTATVSFTSIPSDYKHLQIRLFAKYSAVGAGYTRFNSDTGTNYSEHGWQGDGVSSDPVGPQRAASTTYYSYTGGAGTKDTYFNASIIDILDYTNTNKYKTARAIYGWDGNGTGYVEFNSGNWRNTNAITRIDLTSSAGNFVQYSHIALYGIKG